MSDETPSQQATPQPPWQALVVDRVLGLGLMVELDRIFAALFGIPADILTEKRVQRLTKIQEMRTQKAALLGATEPKALPEKVAQEVLTGAAVEDDPDMQELWANLLANHDAGTELNVYLVGLLKNLDGKAAKALLLFWGKWQAIEPELLKTRGLQQADVSRKSYVSHGDLLAELGMSGLSELARLDSMGIVKSMPRSGAYALTPMGHMLCLAVTGPKASSAPINAGQRL